MAYGGGRGDTTDHEWNAARVEIGSFVMSADVKSCVENCVDPPVWIFTLLFPRQRQNDFGTCVRPGVAEPDCEPVG